MRKLTEQLLGTYRCINEVYYKSVEWLSHLRCAAHAAPWPCCRKKKERMKEREEKREAEFNIREGQVLQGKYRVQTQLGKGSFGQVSGPEPEAPQRHALLSHAPWILATLP